MNDQPITLNLSLINGILQYLGTRPYAEVAEIVKAIHEQAVPQLKVPDVSVEPNENQAS
jgi:hypothetical protein